MDALLKEGIVHKVPKVVSVALEIMAQVFNSFGTKVVPPQATLKALPPLLETKASQSSPSDPSNPSAY